MFKRAKTVTVHTQIWSCPQAKTDTIHNQKRTRSTPRMGASQRENWLASTSKGGNDAQLITDSAMGYTSSRLRGGARYQVLRPARGLGAGRYAPRRQWGSSQPISCRSGPYATLGARRACSFDVAIRSVGTTPQAYGLSAAVKGLRWRFSEGGCPLLRFPLRRPFIQGRGLSAAMGLCSLGKPSPPEENTTVP